MNSKGPPSDLYRCFNERSHADEFLNGRIRFGELRHYRANYEGPRHDVDEGDGRIREWRNDRKAMVIEGSAAQMVDSPGEVNVSSQFGNHVFICCLTLPPDNKWAPVIGDFGEFVVRISDRQRFLKDIRAALSSDQWQKNASVELFPVEYSKDELVQTRDTAQRQNDAMRLAIAQKLPKYSHQFEHRIALISYAPPIRDDAEAGKLPPEHLYVNIGRALEYATLVRKPPRGVCRWLAAALGLVQHRQAHD